MRTLSNNDILGLRPRHAVHNAAVWRPDLATHRGSRVRSSRAIASFRSDATGSRLLPPELQNPELAEEDFPFSALIRLVRVLRQ